jgi:acetyl-CoA acetyltransferase
LTGYPEKRAVISGIGISRIGRRTGIPGLELTVEAAREAIRDAGLSLREIDGIATMGDTPLDETARALGIDPRYRGGGFDTGGLLSPVMGAMVAAGSGQVRHVLVYRTVLMMGGSIMPAKDAQPERAASRPAPTDPRRNPMIDAPMLIAYHAYAAPNWLGMHCERHMHLYGTTKTQLGWLAVESRRKAALNPLAAYRDPLSLDEYMNARPVSTPFGLYDCDVPVDGSIALVVSTAEFAQDCPRKAIRVEAIGGALPTGGWYRRADFPKMASVDAAAEMWSRTDLKPRDVDVAELYDGFTFLTLAWLEALGLCGDGESGPFIEGGERIALDGELPLNTYGGQLSAGRMHGYWVLHEACVQLRGDGGAHQVPDQPEVAVVSAGGGPIAGCMLLTR